MIKLIINSFILPQYHQWNIIMQQTWNLQKSLKELIKNGQLFIKQVN